MRYIKLATGEVEINQRGLKQYESIWYETPGASDLNRMEVRQCVI